MQKSFASFSTADPFVCARSNGASWLRIVLAKKRRIADEPASPAAD